MSKAAAVLLASSRPARAGIVHTEGQAYRDDTGLFHPWGCTFFWAMQGMKHETDRVTAHLEYLASYAPNDVRILGEVDWKDGWHIDPHDLDYELHLGRFMDAAYQRGIRTQITLIGGKHGDALVGTVIEKVARVVNNGRQHMLSLAEIVNERHRLNKMTFVNMEQAGKELRALLPNHLIALSCPEPKPANEPEHLNAGFAAMRAAMTRAGANVFVQHKRRSDAEYGWDHVSQGYDFASLDEAGCDNEPEGPQSSVESEHRPLFISLGRITSVVCGGGKYIFHPGQMVTGHESPEYGRPANLWEVPRIDECLRAVSVADRVLPERVENWKVVNNARDDHPLPLPKPAFWSAPKYKQTGWINKNYSAISPTQFVVVLTGVKAPADGELVVVGKARAACHVEAIDPVSGDRAEVRSLAAGEPWRLPGRRDTEAGYVVRGEFQ